MAVEQTDASTASELEREVARRRTFAIISHPDAGKTTLTEKLLLYGGAIDVAGAVRTRKAQRQPQPLLVVLVLSDCRREVGQVTPTP